MDTPGADPKLELLRRVPLFAGLAPKELEAVGAITEERDVLDGTTLTHEGRHEGYFYVIATGRVRIEREGKTLNTLGDGDFLGEISLLSGSVTSARAVAATEVRALNISREKFDGYLKSHSRAALRIYQHFAKNLGERVRALSTL